MFGLLQNSATPPGHTAVHPGPRTTYFIPPAPELLRQELGYMELDRRGAELLFQVLTEREEKNSVAIASNESSSDG